VQPSHQAYERGAKSGDDRPLGTFSSRIKIAYALGIIGGKSRHDLDIVGNIRNAFAHGMRDLAFDTKEIAAPFHSSDKTARL
jgi:DNA-binding MltR family transcriptional regulator